MIAVKRYILVLLFLIKATITIAQDDLEKRQVSLIPFIGVNFPYSTAGGYDQYWNHYKLKSSPGLYLGLDLLVDIHKIGFYAGIYHDDFEYTFPTEATAGISSKTILVKNNGVKAGLTYKPLSSNWMPGIGFLIMDKFSNRDGNIRKSIGYEEKSGDYQSVGNGLLLYWHSDYSKGFRFNFILNGSYWYQLREFQFYAALGIGIRLSKSDG